MFDKKHGLRPCATAFAVAVALGLSGCGGGGGANVRPSSPPPPVDSGGFAGGKINVGSGDTTVWPNDIGGSVDLIKGGAGTLVLSGTDSYTGGTTIGEGTLQIGNGGTTGSITGNVLDNALLVFDRSDSLTFNGLVSGSGSLRQAGKGTLILTGANTYTGGTTIGSGTLQLGNGGKTGSITGNVADNGSLVFDRSDNVTFNGIVSGSGSLRQVGTGTLILTGTNTYAGGTTISNGTLQIGNGGTTGGIRGNVNDNGTLAFDRSDDVNFAGTVTGTGGLTKAGNGVLTLTGNNGYTGTTLVTAGSLLVDGDQSAATGATIVDSDAILGGKGTLGSDVTVADGATLAPGDKGALGTLTINGNLKLSAGSALDFGFGDQLSDLINVKGNLTLDGTLDVSVAPGDDLGPGVYHLINYDGTLVDNGLNLGGNASGLVAQTGVAHQVNLVNTQGMAVSFWDGDAGPKGNNAINGGNGTWESGSSLSNNWTDATGAVNASFGDRSFAVFQATPGTVTVDGGNGDVNAAGMQFASNGYVVQGDAIHLVGSADDPTRSIIRVGDGSNAGAGYKATINSVLDGTSALVKTDAGTLVLGGANTYTGGTTISGGTLQIGNGGTTGSITGDVTNNSHLVFNRSDDAAFDGIISGTGSLVQAGTGTLTLTGATTYTGGTTISHGTLQIGNGGTTGSITGDVTNNGSLVFNRSSDPIFYGIVSGAISGSGSLAQAGTDTLILTGTNTYSGGTTINSGTLQIGNYGTTGSIVDDVTNNGSLVFSRADDTSFAGIISGTGMLVKTGEGKLALTGAHTYTGGTGVGGGTLEIASGASLGTGSITVGIASPYYFSKHVLQVDSGVSLSNQIVLNGGTLDNAGLLGGTLGTGVRGSGPGATILNHDGGNIKGNDSAVAFAFSGTVENSSGGTLKGDSFGVAMGDGGVVSNDGAGSIIRSAGGMAIQILGEPGTVENIGGGTITSNLTPVYLQRGGTVTNGAGSTLEATGARNGDCGGTGICSIFVASGDSTAYTADGGLTLNNAGTIIGNVQMFPTSHNSAVLSAGGSIQGDLLMGSNDTSFLTLNGGAGTTQLYSQAVTGKTTFAGGLFKSGYGTWIIDSNDLDANAHTEISGGVLQVGNGGVDGSIGSGVVQFNGVGTLVFDRSDDVLYTGQIIGPDMGSQNASLVQAGTGRLTLAEMRVTSYISLTIERGVVQLGNGQFDSIYIRNFDVTNNGSLVFDFGGQTSFESVISGTGSLTKQGPGTLTLWKTNTYAGDTTVNDGTLQTMEALPGNVTVNPGAVLAGIGTYAIPTGSPGVTGNLSNAGSVIVQDSNSLVGGSYTQTATGTLAVNLGSKLDVAGTATLNGGTLEVTGADSGYVGNAHTNVLTAAGGVNGTFSQLVKDTGVVFTATTINYDANSVWLDTTGLNVTTAAAGNGVSYTPASFGSARRVQGAFEQLDSKIAASNLSSVSSDFVRAAGQFQQAPTLQAAQASLQSLSGELHAASAAMTFQAIDASSRALSDRFDNLLDKGTGFGMWMHNLDVGGDMARAGFNGVGFQLNGWLVGSDRQIGRSGVAGYAFGQSRGQQRLDRSYDHDNSRSTEGMLYAGWLDGNRYTQGRVGFGHFQQDVSRQILLGYSAQGVRTQYNGSYSVAYGESGLHFGRGNSQVTPFVDVQYARIDRGGFAEQGAGGFGLRSDAQTLDRWQAGLGVRAGRHWNLDGGRAVDFNARAQWQRTLATHGEALDASFVGMQQWQPLVGIGLSRYSGLLGVGLDATLSAHTTLKFSYDYEMGQRDTAQMASARLNVAF